MQQPYEYITFGEIQQFKTKWMKTHGCGIGFPEAVQALADSGRTHYDVPKKPDFLTWDLESMEQFRKLTDQIPISLKEIRSVKQEINDQVKFLKTLNEVQIGIESVYSDEVFFSTAYFTIIYVLSGSCELHFTDKKINMKKGELCILPPYIQYYTLTKPGDVVISISSDREQFKEQFHALLFHENLLSEFFRHSLFENHEHCLFFMILPTKDLKSIIQHLFQEFVRKDRLSNSLFYNYLLILYANIMRSSQNTRDYYEDKDTGSVTTLMPSILEYITVNYQELTLDKLAEQFHYSPAYLSREIKLHTGMNFAAILADLKLKEAAQLLSDSTLSIDTIARRCGYHSISHFGYAFKQRYNMSASSFRQENR